MKVLFAASEAAPYVKTGGLGDVAYALPNELANNPDVEVAVILPYYKKIKFNPQYNIEFVTSFGVPLSWRVLHCGIFKGTTSKPNFNYYFVDNEYYFNRNNVYGDYDDGERFAYFSRAILEAISHINFYPDVIHCNDWQTALVPAFLKCFYNHIPEYQRIKTLFTIHNIEYQGKVPHAFFREVLGLPEDWHGTMTYDTCLNFMKSAIVLADKVSTVSKTYSFEIRNAYFAHGLENIIQQYSYKLAGIVNGIDTDLYNAQTDKNIYKNFGPGDLDTKAENKMFLQHKLGLPVDRNIPMIAMVTRLASHKGLDLVEYVAGEMMQLPIQFVVIGTGEERFENLFHRLAWENPGKMSANIMFDPVLAQQLYASADLFLMPSKSEPCGLSQLIAMRYGTLPVVRETGGLFDTVQPIDVETGEGRGFTFKTYNAHDMLNSIKTAIWFYNERKDQLRTVVTHDMELDLSWKEPARQYLDLYYHL